MSLGILFVLASLAVVAVAERIVRLVRRAGLHGSWRRRHGYVRVEDPENVRLGAWVEPSRR
ncbi:MAG TPA: hypothetical protein VGK92_11585 [Gaiellales bacterium]|jgi:hypothetical protein